MKYHILFLALVGQVMAVTGLCVETSSKHTPPGFVYKVGSNWDSVQHYTKIAKDAAVEGLERSPEMVKETIKIAQDAVESLEWTPEMAKGTLKISLWSSGMEWLLPMLGMAAASSLAGSASYAYKSYQDIHAKWNADIKEKSEQHHKFGFDFPTAETFKLDPITSVEIRSHPTDEASLLQHYFVVLSTRNGHYFAIDKYTDRIYVKHSNNKADVLNTRPDGDPRYDSYIEKEQNTTVEEEQDMTYARLDTNFLLDQKDIPYNLLSANCYKFAYDLFFHVFGSYGDAYLRGSKNTTIQPLNSQERYILVDENSTTTSVGYEAVGVEASPMSAPTPITITDMTATGAMYF